RGRPPRRGGRGDPAAALAGVGGVGGGGGARAPPPPPAALIRMRALGDPDVDPDGSPGAERWRPWRSYAVRHLDCR
ncbi:hypothetical protein ACFV5K_22935, partial [Streptomyces sp. NPDC059744]